MRRSVDGWSAEVSRVERNTHRNGPVDPYASSVTAADAYELPPHASLPAEAVDAAAERGRIVYLTRDGEPIAAIVPAHVAGFAEAALEAVEDAEHSQTAGAALGEPGSPIPMPEVWADYEDILGPGPGDSTAP